MESYRSSAEPHNSPPIGINPSAINRLAESLTKPISRRKRGGAALSDALTPANGRSKKKKARKLRAFRKDWEWQPGGADMAAIRRGNRKLRKYGKQIGDDYKPKPQVNSEGEPVDQDLSSNQHEREHEREFRSSQSRMSAEQPLRFDGGRKKQTSRFGVGEQREGKE